MELADRAVGFLLTITSLTIFTYYTFWVIILPFVVNDHFIHQCFLSQEYAILIPVFAGVALLCFLSIFIGHIMLKSKKKKRDRRGLLCICVLCSVFFTHPREFFERTLCSGPDDCIIDVCY